MRHNSYGGRSNRSHQNRRRSVSYPKRRNNKRTIDPSRFVKKATPVEEQNYTAKHRFEDFKLHPEIQKAIVAQGFTEPSPVQDQFIPLALEGKDVVGVADTGTGKTAAFLLPLIDKLLANPKQQVLVLAPTRELALQIHDEFRLFSKHMRLYSTLCIGGTPIYKQIKDLNRNPHIIIGTPGRLKDLIQRKALKLDNCHSVVLDEVDRMVDMGFINDIRFILKEVPTQRQSLFLTATIPASVESIMQSFLRDPVRVMVKTGDTAENIEQDVVRMNGGAKIDILNDLLNQGELEKVLVFGETKRGVERLARDLNERGISAVSIHGNKTQSQRQKALMNFRTDNAKVMVATDVAARGLDIKDVTHVINYDIPQSYDDYIHRIGRAGRAGKQGFALTFVR